MSIASTLAEFLTHSTYVDLPAQTTDHATMLIASTLASAACGTDIESAAITRELALERGGRPDASIWFAAAPRLPMVYAARVNAVMSDAAASDDSDLRNIVHAGTPLTATCLAIAEHTGANGEEILAAMVLGYEAAGRIGASITPTFKVRGFHGCLVATFASAVAAARLLRLDAGQMAHTLALSATSIGGLAAAADTSVSREYHAGLATMLGIDAAQAAQRGYSGETAIFETTKGFCDAYGGTDGAGITHGLGQAWDIVTDMAIKLVPGGHHCHALAEASANAARQGDIAPEEIASITISQPGVSTLKGPRHPANLIDMAHSPAYFAAAGAADRTFTWAHATAQKIADPIIHRLIDKVQMGPEPASNVAAYRQGATVTIVTTGGRAVSSTVHVPKGAGSLGLEWADIDAKYRTLAPRAPLTEERVEASLDVLHRFAQITHVAALLEHLRD